MESSPPAQMVIDLTEVEDAVPKMDRPSEKQLRRYAKYTIIAKRDHIITLKPNSKCQGVFAGLLLRYPHLEAELKGWYQQNKCEGELRLCVSKHHGIINLNTTSFRGAFDGQARNDERWVNAMFDVWQSAMNNGVESFLPPRSDRKPTPRQTLDSAPYNILALITGQVPPELNQSIDKMGGENSLEPNAVSGPYTNAESEQWASNNRFSGPFLCDQDQSHSIDSENQTDHSLGERDGSHDLQQILIEKTLDIPIGQGQTQTQFQTSDNLLPKYHSSMPSSKKREMIDMLSASISGFDHDVAADPPATPYGFDMPPPPKRLKSITNAANTTSIKLENASVAAKDNRLSAASPNSLTNLGDHHKSNSALQSLRNQMEYFQTQSETSASSITGLTFPNGQKMGGTLSSSANMDSEGEPYSPSSFHGAGIFSPGLNHQLQADIPQKASSQSLYPQNLYLQNVFPQNIRPQNVHPQNVHPQNAHPQNGYPQNAYPPNLYLQNAHLQNVYAQSVDPQNVYPQNVYAQNIYPQNAPSQDAYSRNNYSQNTYSQNAHSQNPTPGSGFGALSSNNPFRQSPLESFGYMASPSPVVNQLYGSHAPLDNALANTMRVPQLEVQYHNDMSQDEVIAYIENHIHRMVKYFSLDPEQTRYLRSFYQPVYNAHMTGNAKKVVEAMEVIRNYHDKLDREHRKKEID